MRKFYSQAFENTFTSMQCMGWTSLYDILDFDKEQLIKLQKGFTVHDKIIVEKDKYFEVDLRLKQEYDIDCRKLTIGFPYISKMIMAGYNSRKVKGTLAALTGCENATEVYLVIFFHELTQEWGYNREQVLECYEQMKNNALLYRKGMKNDFVRTYFKDELDLEIFLGDGNEERS